jgi:hypothetical protein
MYFARVLVGFFPCIRQQWPFSVFKGSEGSNWKILNQHKRMAVEEGGFLAPHEQTIQTEIPFIFLNNDSACRSVRPLTKSMINLNMV